MPAQLIRIIAPRRRPAQAPNSVARTDNRIPTPAPRPAAPAELTVQQAFHQLVQSLTILRSAAEQVLNSQTSGPTAQVFRLWLAPTARQAEAAMQRLRILPLANASVWIDLTQALTVLVLTADMLVQGQLSPATDLDMYALLRRNADRAMQSLATMQPLLIVLL
jgi:hypothetical protein